MTPEEYLGQLAPEAFTELLENVDWGQTVSIEIPKFKFSYEQELSDVLRTLGVKKAFLDDAEFSKMAETDTGVLKIDQVLHKTYIELDENGTRAAAATAVAMTKNATAMPGEPETVILDRPFVYAIMDTQTNLPIFIGVLNTLE